MGTINAYRDSSDPQLVHIVPSGFQSGETSNINVRFNLTGYDEKVVNFTAQDVLGAVDPDQPSVVPPVNPTPQGQVEVSTSSVTGYTNSNIVISVISSGTFTASCDNQNIELTLDQVRRTITVTVPDSEQLSRQTGDITVSVDTLSDAVISVDLQAVDDISISLDPQGQTQYVNESVNVTVSGTTKEVVLTSSTTDVVIAKSTSALNTWAVHANRESRSVELTVSGEGVKRKQVTCDFLPQEVPVITLDPATGPYRIGSSVNLSVTGITLYQGLNVTSSNPNLPITQGSNQGEYTLEINAVEQTTITVSNRGIVRKQITVVGEDLSTLVARPTSLESAIGLDGRIVISGHAGELHVSSDNPDISARVEGSTIIVSCSEITQGTLTVSSDGCHDLEIQVIYADIVPLVGHLEPNTGTVHVGGEYRLTINGQIDGLKYTISDPRIKVKEVGSNPMTYVISSSLEEGITEINGSVDFSAPGRGSLSVPVEFLELTQFSVDSLEYDIRDTDLPLEITINDLSSELDVYINDPLTMKVDLVGNVITLTNRVELTSNREYVLRLSSKYLEDVIITINVTLDGVKVLPVMPCNGKTYYAYTDETIFFNGPAVDSDDVLEVIVHNSSLKYRIDDFNRIYLNTDKSCPPGRYKMTVKHNDYQDAEVYFVSEALPVQPAPTPVVPEEHYDLGVSPEVTIQTQPDTFVKNVFEDTQLTSDSERLSYVIENGDGVLRDIVNTFCSYNRDMGTNGTVPTETIGGRWNRRIYDMFLFVFGTSDYYEFRNYIRLMIKLMKHYRDTSCSTMLMMRFESGWIGTREELAQFRNIAAFLNKYIDMNGQNVKVSGLQIVGDGFKNMERYCGENIQP